MFAKLVLTSAFAARAGNAQMTRKDLMFMKWIGKIGSDGEITPLRDGVKVTAI
jgi:hypothetical protein